METTQAPSAAAKWPQVAARDRQPRAAWPAGTAGAQAKPIENPALAWFDLTLPDTTLPIRCGFEYVSARENFDLSGGRAIGEAYGLQEVQVNGVDISVSLAATAISQIEADLAKALGRKP